MEQQIRFCTTSDDVSIAYATVGEGPPVVYANGWPTHLELEWESKSTRAFLEALAQGCTLVRYDMRGTGLSDRDVSDFSLDMLVRDLEAVVDHLKLESFALVSLGGLAGPLAITYSAQHLQCVTQLVLASAFVHGSKITTPDRQRAMIEYVSQFGLPLFNLVDAPDVGIEAQRDAQRRQRAAASPKIQAALMRTLFSVDVSGILDRLTMPTLVLHGRQDSSVPFAQGRELAARLPQATFVPFEGQSSAASTQSDVIVPEIRRFLGVVTVSRPRPADGGLVTILFTDVEGSTALTQRLGDAKARDVLREHERIVREALKSHSGSEVKTMGDGFMASFSTATKALECAIAMQRAFAEHNESAPEPIRVRIGLNAGEPIAEDDPDGRSDLFGTAVNEAARITATAKGGEILVSNVVRELAKGKDFLFADRGEATLKGFDEPVRLYEVRWRADPTGAQASPHP
jgi:class 3 adenylate cyclase/pimeloyl-ACP methyl ester carboxylesterase